MPSLRTPSPDFFLRKLGSFDVSRSVLCGWVFLGVFFVSVLANVLCDSLMLLCDGGGNRNKTRSIIG